MEKSAGAVLAEVASQVKGSDGEVYGRVVKKLVERDVAARADLLTLALDKFDENARAFKKLKPDIPEVFGEDGVLVSPAGWTKKASEERKKAKDKNDALARAIEDVLTAAKPDAWPKLREVMNKQGGKDQGNSNEKQE